MICPRSWTSVAVVSAICVGIASAGLAMADELYELGEYLSGECQSCHRTGGDGAIPAIGGLAVESFVLKMQAYKDGTRKNPVMQRIARNLSDEDVKALAVFYEKLGQ